jgi:hypothetical protein
MPRASTGLPASTQQISYAALLPLLKSGGGFAAPGDTVTAVGTERYFTYLSDGGPTFPDPATAGGAADTNLDIQGGNGITFRYPKKTTVVDGLTALDVVGASATGGSNPSDLHFTTIEWGASMQAELEALIGKLVIACVSMPDNIDATELGWMYIAGTLGGFNYTKKGNEVMTVTLTVTGGSFTADPTGGTADVAITWAPDAKTPFGEDDDLTPEPLETADLARLKSGLIVTKQV